MLIQREFDLNSVDISTDSVHYMYTDSLKEVMKKTMLDQEIVFRKQVFELHRLYRMQKTLMQNNRWKEFGEYNLNEVGLAQTKSQELMPGCQGALSKLLKRPLDLQLPLNHYIGHVETEELKLSLSSGEDNGRKLSVKRTCFEVKMHSFPINVIDLEESTETLSNENSGVANSGSKHESQNSVITDPIISSGLKKDPPSETPEKNSFLDNHGRNSFDLGNVDLNKIYCDDSSCHSNDPTMNHPSTASSSHPFSSEVGGVKEGSFRSTFWNKEYNTCSDDAENLALIDLNSNLETKEISGSPKQSVLSSSSEVDLGLEVVPRHKNDPSDGNVGLELEISKIQVHTCPATRVVNHEMGLESGANSDLSSASIKPCHIGDNESSNGETTQSEVELGNSLAADRFLGNQNPSQALETFSGEQNQHEYLSKKESDKVDDVLVQEAAESLLSFAVIQGFSMKDAGSTEMENNERAMPECSFDSYELLTLKLKQSSEDDLCVSSKLPEIDFEEKKDYGLKIRRGRRLKDFQRDILPGLASLSRHEIREDISIIEGVLRSREYKKFRAKMADEHNWCKPAKSRRSQLNYTARRRFS
ncbi:hypothetical protein UlMin_001335 [Ulmus minor]